MPPLNVYLYERDIAGPGPPTPVTVNGDPSGLLVFSEGRKVRDVVHGLGNGEITYPLASAGVDQLAFGRMLMFEPPGAAAKIPVLIEREVRKVIARDGRWQRVTTVSGRNAKAVLAEAIVYPERPITEPQRQKARLFNPSSLAFDPTVWTDPIVVTPQQGNYGPPGPWPDQSRGQWILDQDSTTPDVPPGRWWFVKDFAPDEDLSLGHFIAGDDLYDLYIDNELRLQEDHFYAGQAKGEIIQTFTGYHRVAVRLVNVNLARAGLKYACYVMGDKRQPISLLFESDDSWWVYGDAAEPGFTPGKILDTLLTESQDRGEIPDVTWTFDAVNDSNGNAWSTESDIAIDIGRSLLEVDEQLSQAYIDSEMTDELEYRAYNFGTRGGGPSGGTWTAGGELAEQIAEGEG